MLALGDKIIAGSFKAGASWEVGDVGISAFGIDEALNKRRYLNGQVISQAQFVEFTAVLKSRVSVYPNLSTTEVNWQATVTNSDLGQCGQFVIDDDAGTIRLPKVVNINGLQDLTGLGIIKAESLPNITGDAVLSGTAVTASTSSNGALSHNTTSSNRAVSFSNQNDVIKISFNASLSSSTYQDNAPVQQEAVQYPYFIQVAEGVETSVDVSREIELNNPFSLLDYKYSEYELSNASWLISNGQYNSGATYSAVYNLLLAIYNGTTTKAGVSVKLSTDTYADTDFVVNTSDTTFRLPLYTQRVLVKKYVNGTEGYNLYSDGWIEQWGKPPVTTAGANTVNLPITMRDTNYTVIASSYTNAFYASATVSNTSQIIVETRGHDYSVQGCNAYWRVCGYTTPPSMADYTEIKGLYFYVGDTVQDANIIAAAGVLTDVAGLKNASNFSSVGKEAIVGWGEPDYTAGVAVSSGYTATQKGWALFDCQSRGGNNQAGYANGYINGVLVARTEVTQWSYNTINQTFLPIEAGDVLTGDALRGSYTITVFPCKGV